MSKPELINLPTYTDERGSLVPVWNNWGGDDYQKNNVLKTTSAGADLCDIKRAYFIENSQKGVVRGLHYHEREAKYFVVIQGLAKFVTIPLTQTDMNFLNEHTDPLRYPKTRELEKLDASSFVLSDRNAQMLAVPPGYANGWMSLTDDCLLLALSSSTFEESKNDDRRLDPYVFGDVWSVGAR